VERSVAPSYSTRDPRGWGGDPQRGAAYGRTGLRAEPKDYAGKLVLQRVYLNSGGYDKRGTYWGLGAPLYWYANDEGTIDDNLRAFTREDAKEKIRKLFPKVRFYR